MSHARGSVTPSGKQRPFDYPATPAQQGGGQGSQTQATPIHIAPRASPRGAATPSAAPQVSMAQSCPTFSWQPPAAPSARPRIASIEPPPMELPPSPPVFSPMQAEAVKGKKDDSASSLALKKQIYSRSLSNYSSSAPTHVDYLSKFQPNLGQLDELDSAGVLDESDEEEDNASSGYRPSGRAMQQQARRDLEEDASSGVSGGVGIGIGIGLKSGAQSRVSALARNDDFSLSKSPTIFSILSTSAHNSAAHPGMHTADTSTSSTASGSPGHSILGSIAAGENPKRRSLQSNKAPVQQQSAAAKQQADAQAEDDLQFSISLTDEQEGEGDDGNKQDFMPLY